MKNLTLKHIFQYGLMMFFGCISSHSIFGQSVKYTLSGYIKEANSGELLPGATVYIPELEVGSSTNTYGFYSITIKAGHYTLQVSSIGYESIRRPLDLSHNLQLELEMIPKTQELEEVVITGDGIELESEQTPMSVMHLSAAEIKNTPALMGENDVMKTLQLMPGVQAGTEGSAGIYVRGGSPDQNLLILDDAVVYNANHLFGFFSVFNGDALKSVEMIKGGFPARFGGRLSSVVKMDMKDGNKETLTGNFKIGLISSSLLLEGPLKKNKTSFLFSGRRTYLDLLSIPFQPEDINGGYHFTDVNFKINHNLNAKNKLYFSAYFGRDKFFSKEKYGSNEKYETSLGWGNITSTVRWNHQFSGKLFSNLSFIFSHYDFTIREENKYDGETYKLRYLSGIKDFSLKSDFDYFPNPSHSIKFGMISTSHSFTPQAVAVKDTEFGENSEEQDVFNSIESAVYAEDDWQVNKYFNVLFGLRLSMFHYKSLNYIRPEPRITASWRFNKNMALKGSYAQMNQYIHLLSNSGIGLPTDLWVSSTDRVLPQKSDQVALGWIWDFKENRYSLSVETYSKTMDHVISYKEGASFLLLDDFESSKNISWEDNITAGKGWAYGAEVLLRKKKGKFTGWLGYTLSWSQRQFDEINLGRKFNSKYDRRHNLSLVGMYNLSDKISLSGTWVFRNGINYTLPKYKVLAFDNGFPVSGSALAGTYEREYITDMNNFRGENYHRLDIGIQFHKNKNNGKVRTWSLSVYNVYNRKNAFFYFLDESYDYQAGYQGGYQSETKLKKVSIFTIIPSITYSLTF